MNAIDKTLDADGFGATTLIAIEATRFVKAGGPLTKKLHLTPDGKLVNDSSRCRMSSGRIERLALGDWRAFAGFIEATPPNVAYSIGALRDGLPEVVQLVLKDDERSDEPGFVPRTKDNFNYREGEPALALLDHDSKGMPDAVRERLKAHGSFVAAIASICPAFALAGYIQRPSTSAGVFNSETGDQYSSTGEHVYPLVKDGSDILRFLQNLFERAWLAGDGWYIVSKSGALLERSIVDKSVGSAERLTFEADAELEPPLKQAPRRATIHDGVPLDTRTACPDLTPAEIKKLRRLKAVADEAIKPRAEAARAAFREERYTDCIKRGMSPEKARATAEAWCEGKLTPGATLDFYDRKIGRKTVADVLSDLTRFDGEPCADPIEGVEYGHQAAIVYVHPNGEVWVHSYAHGGMRYQLIPDGKAGEVVLVKGIEKRLTTLDELNERFALLKARGEASVYISRPDFLPIHDIDLRRRLAGEVVRLGEDKGKVIYDAAFAYWTGNARRHTYDRIEFTSREDLPPDVYNLYRGLGVTPRAGSCRLILSHIREVICSDDLKNATAMLNLMGWQIQNIGKPSRIIVVLKSKGQQVGKGILLGETMLKIWGPSGFQPATIEQVFGKFNDVLRGRSFIFLDEVLFAGDRRSADAIKRLSTTDTYGIETKNLPIVHCPIGPNFWLSSNHDNAAFIEEHDERYWVLDVSEYRLGDTGYFAALLHEIENGGREAFAHYLLNLDVSKFVPARDVPKANAAKQEMIKLSINPYDARKWLEDCCHVESLLGNDAVTWKEGTEVHFYALRNAYVEWQKGVKTRIAPEPTAAGALGAVLTAAGFGSKHTNDGAMRVMPTTKTCLESLYKAAEKTKGAKKQNG